MNEENQPLDVYIVDDELFVRKYITEILNVLGHNLVGYSENADSLMNKIDSIKCDLMLMDICLPGETGDSLLGRVKQARPDLNVVMISTRNSLDLIKKCKTTGAIGYILKQGDVEQISDKLRHYADKISRKKIANGM